MMLSDPSQKYRAFPQVDLPDRQWPSKTITKAPRWLSTDMRDGNQSLMDPMNAEKKQRFFDLLIKVGIKEIEVGFPSAGATEFDFISGLVKNGSIPDDVIVQVLTQARPELIATTFESLRGAKQAIVHVYNAVSPAWRRIVFGMERSEVRQIAIDAAKLLRDNAAAQPDTDWFFEYSPETFSTADGTLIVIPTRAVSDDPPPPALQAARERKRERSIQPRQVRSLEMPRRRLVSRQTPRARHGERAKRSVPERESALPPWLDGR